MKGNLKSHVVIKHGAENSFQCTRCSFRCNNKTALRQHSREHEPVQPIQCSKCTYSCSSKGALKVHERIHSEERPFKCDCCKFASKQRSNLVIHRKKCHSDKSEKRGAGKRCRGEGKSGVGDSPKPASSRYRAKLDAARVFSCDLCDASFVREDSLRSHKKQHRDAQNVLHFHLSNQADGTSSAVGLVPVTRPQINTQLVPLSSDSMVSNSSAQLKIIVSHPLCQEMIPAGVDSQNKTSMVLLRPESQDFVVNSMIQQVNLLTPMQPMRPSQTADATFEPQTVLLAQLAPDDTSNPLHQALLQTAITAQDSGSSTPTFITTCSELESLSALIQEGGREVTVVTEGNGSMVTTSTPSDLFCAPLKHKPAGAVRLNKSALLCEESVSLSSNISMGSQNVVIHGVPVSVSTQPQQSAIEELSSHTLY